MRRAARAALVLVAALALSACAGMPTSGPVTAGKTADDVGDSLDLSFRPAGPQRGATPEQIVEGFVAAGTSPAEDWGIARLFLAPSIAAKWNPDAGVTVDDLVDRDLAVVSKTAMTLTVSAVAEVDDTGAYSETDSGPVPLPFELAQQADGEWRITKATDGIVLDRDLFPQVFRAYALMYFDPSWHYLVPDERWFPARSNTAARIVQSLMDGAPSPWLTGAVVTAFPDDVTAPEAVPLVDGIAQVEVPPAALGLPRTQLSRMQAQLEASLASANISDAVMTVGSVDVVATPALTRSTRIDPRPAVLTKKGFGFLVGNELEPIAGITQGMRDLSPTAIELSPDRDFAAARLESGEIVRVLANQKNVSVDARQGLIAPTVDGLGYIWSVPGARPSALLAVASDGSMHAISDAWGAASAITAMQLSRDGTRMVALVETGGRSEAWVAGVVRDNGVPVRLGQWQRLAVLPGIGTAVSWLDDTTVGILTAVGGDISFLTQQIGGLTAPGPNPPDRVTTVSGGSQVAVVRLLGDDATMYVKTGTRWQQSAKGILVIATQQGTPQ